MDSSLLGKLPRELRDGVYVLVLHAPNDIHIYDEDGQPSLGDALRIHKPLALTTTCKQIRGESLPLFYAVNRLCLDVWPEHLITQDCDTRCERYNFKAFRHWITQITPIGITCLRRINIDLGFLGKGTVTADT